LKWIIKNDEEIDELQVNPEIKDIQSCLCVLSSSPLFSLFFLFLFLFSAKLGTVWMCTKRGKESYDAEIG
jgi:hypothetical protein